jgi:hypothetical protein
LSDLDSGVLNPYIERIGTAYAKDRGSRMTVHTTGAIANPRLFGKAGGKSWVARNDASAQAARARAAWHEKLLSQAQSIEDRINPSPTPEAVERRYKLLLAAHMAKCAARSSAVRRARRASTPKETR